MVDCKHLDGCATLSVIAAVGMVADFDAKRFESVRLFVGLMVGAAVIIGVAALASSCTILPASLVCRKSCK